jgi:predicted Ser/Thr protein kinase
MTDYSPEVATAIAELGDVHLPEEIRLLEVAGRGSRSIVFKATYRGETVALKVYRPEAIEKYRKKYELNIAVFEMSQNRKFRKVPELLPFSAKPIMVLGHDGKQSVCFMQEFIDGKPLTELAEANKGVPSSVLEAGEVIARAGEQAGLKELDLDYRDVMVRPQAGRWLPVIHDFNQVPSEHPANKAFMGLFKKGPRPNYEIVRDWASYSEECAG